MGWPSNVKWTSSTPCFAAHSPNAASAPFAPPLNRMQSSGFIVFTSHFSLLTSNFNQPPSGEKSDNSDAEQFRIRAHRPGRDDVHEQNPHAEDLTEASEVVNQSAAH